MAERDAMRTCWDIKQHPRALINVAVALEVQREAVLAGAAGREILETLVGGRD